MAAGTRSDAGPEPTGQVPDRHDRTTTRTRRRFARRQWARRWLSLRYVLALLLVVALAGTAVHMLLFSATMQVKRVEVVGNALLSDGRVREIADVPLGDQLALVDLGRAGARVGSLAEVRSVDVTRTWPDAVRIEVVERTPVAVVELAGRLRGLDADGIVFREYDRVPDGMPRIRPGAAAGTDALKEAATVVSALPEDLATRVDHVEVTTIDQITLVMRDRRQVLWGSAEDSELKAQVVDRLLAAQQASSYDVSVPGNPTYRP
ncbi:cell division protein FtsQ [Nocardioides flavus (ex Wang et al. 2016)]|uniref:Cell division protein FtsQ n=1 Tax=Nocardioides flavus (ex Wang et al. 2016) TaxID=2058780 RepID=A0ABQ3HHS7_9ACTN|nr:FtsQ-type POTRA domain-containing protein [Nocardioides flavus (ex Wang et al. 2016)]GHE17210.1 cell division protein FtsQ [Nocardioides flavus (ex Wang et al. 2016)]